MSKNEKNVKQNPYAGEINPLEEVRKRAFNNSAVVKTLTAQTQGWKTIAFFCLVVSLVTSLSTCVALRQKTTGFVVNGTTGSVLSVVESDRIKSQRQIPELKMFTQIFAGYLFEYNSETFEGRVNKILKVMTPDVRKRTEKEFRSSDAIRDVLNNGYILQYFPTVVTVEKSTEPYQVRIVGYQKITGKLGEENPTANSRTSLESMITSDEAVNKAAGFYRSEYLFVLQSAERTEDNYAHGLVISDYVAIVRE